jgi:hypothetical protein
MEGLGARLWSLQRLRKRDALTCAVEVTAYEFDAGCDAHHRNYSNEGGAISVRSVSDQPGCRTPQMRCTRRFPDIQRHRLRCLLASFPVPMSSRRPG